MSYKQFVSHTIVSYQEIAALNDADEIYPVITIYLQPVSFYPSEHLTPETIRQNVAEKYAAKFFDELDELQLIATEHYEEGYAPK